ncbi:DUF167 domain-containing protein [Deferribacter thermophilus]|uniref:DUF167 domain-containing protein n=1 Tax=Deferribacter thermophilus TaxID=53573 RepID=UPI003C193884
MGGKVTFYIQPGAKKTEVAGEFNGMRKIKVASPPVDGSANKELINFLAKKLNISKSSIKIIGGEKSRVKTLEFLEDVDMSKL